MATDGIPGAGNGPARTGVRAATGATLDTAGLTFAGFLTGVIIIVGGQYVERLRAPGPLPA